MVVTLTVTTLAALAQLLAAERPARISDKYLSATRQPVRPLFAPLQQPGVAERSPQVLCTMPILRPDANVDPKIVVEPQKGVDFKIRTIDTPACVERPTR